MENLKCRGDAIAKKISDAMKVKAVLYVEWKRQCLLSVPGVFGCRRMFRSLFSGSKCVKQQ